MKETVNIRYKSIISHETNDKVTDEYTGEAIHQLTMVEESYTFTHPQHGRMQVLLKGNELILSHGQTKMTMAYQERRKILYNVMYGQLELTVYLKKMDRTDTSLNIIYYLYDGSTILSKCYLVLERINLILS